MVRVGLVLAVLLAPTLAACGTERPDASGSPGGGASQDGQPLHGRVVRGPTTPHEPVGQPPGGSPVAGARVTVAGSSGPTLSATTDAEGRFTVTVPPGTYVVSATPSAAAGAPSGGPGMRPATAQVVVRDAPAHVTVRIDSGIR